MRLPTDATLLLGEHADPELERVWRDERLPALTLSGLDRLEAELEAMGATTVVVCGDGAAIAAATTAALGFRTFLVGEAAPVDAVVTVTVAQAVEAARLARARERWKAARGRSA